jgi:anti-anti-sigma factor
MDIASRQENVAVVIAVQGKLDALTVQEFDACLSAWLSEEILHFVINFSGLEYISSAGLRSILAVAKALKSRKGEMIFTGVGGHVAEVFKMSHFFSVFRIFKDEETALNALGGVETLGSITLPAEVDSLTEILAFISSHAEDQGFEPMKVKDIKLAAEEALVNITRYAYSNKLGDVTVTCKQDRGKFVIQFVDKGKFFDIHDGKSKKGLGTFLIKKLISDVQYKRRDGKNILELIIPKM